MACLLCDSENHSLLHDRVRSGRKQENYLCENCGFVFAYPRPSWREHELLYAEGQFSEKERRLKYPTDEKFLSSEKTALKRMNVLESHFDSFIWGGEKRNMLEVGSGCGAFLRLMKASGWKVYGLEPDEKYAEAAIQRYGVEVDALFLEDLSAVNQFDMIASFHVIEHVADPTIFLSKLRVLLRDDGIIYLECPSLDRWYGDSIDFFFLDEHINTFTEATLCAFLDKSGFEELKKGWNNNFLWVIAKKSEPAAGAVAYDDPNRVRAIVDKAKKSPQVKPQKPGQSAKTMSRSFRRGFTSTLNMIQEKIVGKPEVDACDIAIKPRGSRKPNARIAHVGLHTNGNAGDTLLFPCVRQLFQSEITPTSFTTLNLRSPVTEKMIHKINRHDALVIGGGGLFLADTNPNEVSGWQWACPVELLDKVKVPIVVFAVGFNRFRGQGDFSSVFKDNLKKLVEKSVFFGVRNRGSIDALKNYLPSTLHDKLIFQPCPTTCLDHYYPGVRVRRRRVFRGGRRTLAINMAFDRHFSRFGNREHDTLSELAGTLRRLQGRGWSIKMFNHMEIDREARFWFRANGLAFDEVNLGGRPPIDVIKEYSNATLAVGMRGHAQMIPFGLGRPILSLVSHDKLNFFLQDIGHPEWGIDVNEGEIGNRFFEKTMEIEGKLGETERQVRESKTALWEVTLANARIIKDAF